MPTINQVIEEGKKKFEEMEDQPCCNFVVHEISVSGEGAQPHQCPRCEGIRYFCANCHFDHHKGGWKKCFIFTDYTTSLLKAVLSDVGEWAESQLKPERDSIYCECDGECYSDCHRSYNKALINLGAHLTKLKEDYTK